MSSPTFLARLATAHGPSRGPSRRGLLAGGAGLAALLVALPQRAHALSLEDGSALLRDVTPAPGALDWETLRGDTATLEGTKVSVSGYMLPLEDGDSVRRFVLSPLQAHCIFCAPGTDGMVTVESAQPVALIPGRRTMTGLLQRGPLGEDRLTHLQLGGATVA